MKTYEEQKMQDTELVKTASSLLVNDDRFDNIDKLRLTQNFSEAIGVKKVLITVPVRKPGKQEFVRIRPGDDWSLQTAILQFKEDQKSYLVDPALCAELPGDVVPTILFTTINREKVLTLWPARLPRADGRQDHWSRSALEVAERAKTEWVRISANMSLGAYEVVSVAPVIPEPIWPDVSFKEILRIAFREQYINCLDHPVVQRLRGLR